MSAEILAIRAAFETQGLASSDLVSKEALLDVLSRLNSHQTFNEEVFEELWEQCQEDSLGKVEIRDFVDVVYRAKHILTNRVIESKRRLEDLEDFKATLYDRRREENDSDIKKQLGDEADEVDEEIRNVEESIVDSKADLELLNKPFFKQSPLSIKSPSILQSPYDAGRADIPSLDELKPFSLPSTAEQRLLLGFAILGFLLEIMIIFSKIGFLNLLAYSMIFTFFVMPRVPRQFWTVSMCLLGVSLPVDIAWLTLYSPSWWSFPQQHLNSVGFQRYCIVMTALLLLLKAYAGVLLFIGFRPKTSQTGSRFI